MSKKIDKRPASLVLGIVGTCLAVVPDLGGIAMILGIIGLSIKKGTENRDWAIALNIIAIVMGFLLFLAYENAGIYII